MPKKVKWQYGPSPNPTNWAEAANVLKSLQTPKKKPNVLMERLAAIDKKLKDK